MKLFQTVFKNHMSFCQQLSSHSRVFFFSSFLDISHVLSFQTRNAPVFADGSFTGHGDKMLAGLRENFEFSLYVCRPTTIKNTRISLKMVSTDNVEFVESHSKIIADPATEIKFPGEMIRITVKREQNCSAMTRF